jgi:four helix bundle protein
MKDNVIRDKSYQFALKIIELYKSLTQQHKDYVLSRQVLKAGTSIGANVNEALEAESRADFTHKLSIALKEARETAYWLRLLKDADYIYSDDLLNSCKELKSILVAIIKTTKGLNSPGKERNNQALIQSDV